MEENNEEGVVNSYAWWGLVDGVACSGDGAGEVVGGYLCRVWVSEVVGR